MSQEQPRSGAVALPCKLCGAPTAHHSERHGFAIVRCGKCGFRFAIVPADCDLDAIYADDAFWNGGTSYGYAPNYDEALRESAPIFERRMARINRFTQPGRLLEIGCAGGYALKLAQENGWTVAGTELSEPMRRRAAELVGAPIYRSLPEIIATGQRFDCILMYEVLEHVLDPVGMLRGLREIMAPDAMLALSTPNFDGHAALVGAPVSVWIEPPAHICYFGPRTLALCLERAGFKQLELERPFNPEMPLPAPIAAMLRPWRRGKRLRPRGLLGKILKAYQIRRPSALYWLDYLVVYARRKQ